MTTDDRAAVIRQAMAVHPLAWIFFCDLPTSVLAELRALRSEVAELRRGRPPPWPDRPREAP